MIIFNDEISLENDAAHWYINQAAENNMNEFDLFEIVLTEYYLEKTIGEE